ncbi:GntR family transcriptional regulator [Lichenibacterium dinghuense]|uniref:GntR family transcriptional regulator n=1 Tax=Lichenibacterium dinghuense TaxID=2895977 RepID=UPI001F4227DE|nr:GntR family transcriptional regulator [Lichenibacterium sp. 6Y81]
MRGAPDLARLPRVTLAGQVAGAIRDAVLSGAFAPGQQMNEAELAVRFAVSRGPVREALQRLVQEGLLVSHPHRGVFVVELTEADLADVYLAREAIEATALRRIAALPDRAALAPRLDAEVARMDAAAAARDWTAVAAADLAFHRALVEAAGSPRLSRMYDTVQAETRLCLHLLMGGYRSSAGLAAEHGRLAALATRGDLDAALAELGRHLADPIRYLRRLGATPPAPDAP